MPLRCLACLLSIPLSGAIPSNGEEACSSIPDLELSTTGEALLQRLQSRDSSILEVLPSVGKENTTTTRPVLEPPPHLFDLLQTAHGNENTSIRPELEPPPHLFDLLDLTPSKGIIDEDDEETAALLSEAGYSRDGYQGAPSCVPSALEAKRRQSAFFAHGQFQDPYHGASASLDADGFLSTTTMCCPHEMEQFFVRLLYDRGLHVCSKPHVQGLMHWFSCVPDMDFKYVLDVIDNGNPCKYWAPKGETCPTLSIECAGEYCGAAKGSKNKSEPKNTTVLTTTTTTTTTTNACEGDVELKFWEAAKYHNNVGGKGPDSGDQYLRIGNLGTHKGKVFDLLVSSTSDRYQTPVVGGQSYAQHNGVYGYFGYLTMSTGSQFDINFRFVETNTTIPIPLEKFYFTFFDLDTGDVHNNQSGAAEEVSATGYEKYFVGPSTELNIQKNDNGVTSWKATKYGTGDDNPKNPLNLTQQQQNRAVTLQFMDTSEFEATYVVKPGASVGRDIYFAGKSQLALNPCFGGDAFKPTDST